ncbi:MAG TPA: medium chain dehydrogenase/reductase family protein [Polyangiaceae bacterium]|nr:medium chain dehydrogenase/reductase family protein [Polyangiaceae bacterium]
MSGAVRKVVIHRAGSYEQLRVESASLRAPGPDEVVLDVAAAGVNYADVIVRMGLYSSARELVGWPITPGFEVAGTVRAVGANVRDVSVGARALAVTLFGGYASAIVAPRAQVFSLPSSLTFEQGAALPAVFLTAYFALHVLAHPRRGERVLIHSAAGGVGTAAIQLAKRAGCEVTGVVGGPHKVELCARLGCDHVIDKSSEDLWARVEAIAPRGFDHVLDANGVSTLKQSYEHLARPGKLVVYGFAAMMPKTGGRPSYLKLARDYLRTPRFNPLDMTQKSRSVLAFNLSYLFDRMDVLAEGMALLEACLVDGSFVPPPVATYPLTDVARAHRDLESGQTVGKLVLVPG